MSSRYRATGAVREPDLPPDPNRLFWMLDGLASSKGKHIVFDALEESDRFIQVLSLGDRKFNVEWRATNAGDLYAAPGADLLIAQQIILRCMQDKSGWESVRDQIAGRLGFIEPVADVQVDYASTGISISNATQDYVARMKNLGVPVEMPPTITWGGLRVSTGDTWRGLRGDLKVAIEVDSLRLDALQGISISSPQGPIQMDGVDPQAEIIVWPTEAERRFELRVAEPCAEIRVTTVYEVSGKNWSRIDRWTEESGFWIESVSPDHRVYHSNYYATSPPTFDDLVFDVQISAR